MTTPYSPINLYGYIAAQAGATAGMGVGGWITDSNPADYELVTSIAGIFAQAFDQAWNNGTAIDTLEQQAITAIVTQEFAGRAPGPLSDPTYQEVSTWAQSAAACVALVRETDAAAYSRGITPPPIAESGGQSIITTVVTYYVDPLHGNDANSGTETMPVQTWNSGVRKLLGGFTPNVQGLGNLTITYLNAPPSTDPISLNPTVGETAYVLINVQIENFVATTCTITGTTPKLRASGGNQWQITTSEDLTSYAGTGGTMIHDVTNDSWFWLDSIISGSGAEAVLQLSQPLARVSMAAIAANGQAIYVPELDTLTPGDTLVIYTWPNASFQYLYDESDENENFGFGVQNFNCNDTLTYTSGFVSFLECNTPSILGANWSGAQVNCYGYNVDQIVSTLQIVGGQFQGNIWAPSGGFICADVLTSARNSEGLIIKISGDDFAIDSVCTLDSSSAVTIHGRFSVRVDDQFSTIYEGDGIIYGKGFIQASFGGLFATFSHTHYPLPLPAAIAFQVPRILLDDYNFASANNTAVTPSQWLPHIELTGANIDAAVSAGGFGGIAYGIGGSLIGVYYEFLRAMPIALTPSVDQTNLLQFTVANPFTQPAISSSVSVSLTPINGNSPKELTIGQNIYIVGGGRYTVSASTLTGATLVNTGDSLNAAVSSTVPANGNASAVNLTALSSIEILVNPLGIGTADWPRVISLLRDAAPNGKIIVLRPGTFEQSINGIYNDLAMCDHAHLKMSAETKIAISSTGSQANTPLFLIGETGPTQGTSWDLVLAGTFPATDQGVNVITLTYSSAYGAAVPVPGQWLVLASPENIATANTWWYQRKVVSIVLVSGNVYTVTLDRGLPRGFLANGNQVYTQYLSSDGITIDGNYATLGTGYQPFFIENDRNLEFGRFHIDGSLGWPAQVESYLLCLSAGSWRSRIHDLVLDMTGNTGSTVNSGISFGSTEDCLSENVTALNCGAGFIFADCVTSGLVRCEGSNGYQGVVFTTDGGTPSIDGTDGCISCYIRDSQFNGNSTFGVYDIAGNGASVDLVLDNVTANGNANVGSAGFYLGGTGTRANDITADYNYTGIQTLGKNCLFSNTSCTGNSTVQVTNRGTGTVFDGLFISRTVNNQNGITNGGGSCWINDLLSYDNFTGTDQTTALINVWGGSLTIRKGIIGGNVSGNQSIPNFAFYMSAGTILDIADLTILSSYLILTGGTCTIKMKEITFTSLEGLGLDITNGVTLWIDSQTSDGLPNTNYVSGCCFISRPVQLSPGVWSNTAPLINGLWAVPWPQIAQANRVELTRTVPSGTVGYLEATFPVSGQLSASSASFAVSGDSLTVTPSAGGGSAATIAFASNQTAAQAVAAINVQFASAGTKAVASVAGDGTFVYVAPTANGITLAMSGTAAAVFGFVNTVGLVVYSNSNTDTSTVSYSIN